MNKKSFWQVLGICFFWLATFGLCNAQDLVVLGGTYDQAEYPGYKTKGTYKVQLSKTDSYVFTAEQFEINVSLPPQGSYDPTRASEVILPAGWEMIVAQNPDGSYDNGSFILRLTQGSVFSGSGPGVNRRRDFYIPILTTAGAVDQPTLVTVQWNDFEVVENPQGNTGGSVLNVLDVPLPVTLVSFNAVLEGNSVNLTWATTMETNSDRFEIEKSLTGKNWSKIGSVTSNGESNALKSYSYVDANPSNGENLYRLKMVDKDLTFAYSRIRAVTIKKADDDLSVYPNPSSDFIRLRDVENVTAVSIMDLNGIKVYQSSLVKNAEIRISNLTPGLYSVRIEKKNGVNSVQKLVVVR